MTIAYPAPPAAAPRPFLHGHLWTVAPAVRHLVRPRRAPGEPWETTLVDPKVGAVRLTGHLLAPPGAEDLVVIVHGCGGTPESYYCHKAAHAGAAVGMASLRLALRGADRLGEDYYHAGLTDDLHAALESPAVARFARLFVLGYSIGGQTVLRYATESRDRRLRAVAAICPPLDLDVCCRAIDGTRLYCHWVLSGLKRMYRAVALRRPVPTPLAEVERTDTIRAFDALTMVPRHGFADVVDYYARSSAGPLLGRLEVPALLVAAERDPMVPLATYQPWLGAAAPALEVRRSAAGGHLGFPPDLDLGVAAPRGLENQVLGWLRAAGGGEWSPG